MGANFREWLPVFLGRTRSLRALARELNITETSIMAWRDGRSTPGLDLIPRLAELSGEDPKTLHDMILAAKTERAQANRRRWQGMPDTSSSGWNSARRPLAKADHAAEPLGTTGAERLHRLEPARA